MKAILNRAALFLLLSSPVLHAAPPVQWTTGPGANGAFLFSDTCRNGLESAEAYAVAQGGHLASITSQAEQDFINNTFLVLDDPNVPLWIGLKNQTPDAVVPTYNMWTSGEPLTYTNWNYIEQSNVQEPNNQGGSRTTLPLTGTTRLAIPILAALGTICL